MVNRLVGRAAERERVHAAVRSSAGAVVTGDLGVGKSRLAARVLDELEERSVCVVRIAATASTRTIPLGAFGDLVPVDRRALGSPELLPAMAQVVRRRAAGRPAVVGVDDAHLLDDASAALVHHLVVTATAAIVATVRTGPPRPDAVTALWKDRGARRIQLEELGVEDARSLVTDVLGGPPSEELWAHLWRTARGNPLFLSELVRGGLERGIIRDIDGSFHLEGRLAPSTELTEVVTARLDRCSPQGRAALDMLAMVEPLPIAVVEAAVDQDAVLELEHTGLVTVGRSGMRVEVRTSHPIVAETLRSITPAGQRRRHARRLVEAMKGLPARRADDTLQIGMLRLEAGAFEEPRRFLQAATKALERFDAELAERLVLPVLDADPIEARLLLGRSLRLRHRVEEAEEHLRAAAALATHDSQRARAAIELAQTQFYGRHQPSAASTTLELARAEVQDPDWIHEMDAVQALVAAFTGNLVTASRLGDRVLREHPAPTTAVLNTLAVSTVAQILRGRCADARRALRVAMELTTAAPTEASLAVELLHINRFSLDLCRGNIEQAVQRARVGYQRVSAEDRLDVVGVWGSTFTQVLLPGGDITTATAVAADAMAALELSDPVGQLPMTAAIQGYVAGHAGDAEGARRHLSHPALPAATDEARARCHVDRAEVWALAAEGQLASAAQHAVEGGQRAADAGLLLWAAMLLHDAVRLRHPARAAPLLRAVADHVDGGLAEMLADHGEALRGGDATAVARVADRFREVGATLLAAEAAAQAGELLLAAGQQRAGRRSLTRARELARRCPGARTPELLLAPQPLTARERTVALLAIGGRSNREIADELGIAKRTVDNHLASVYRKLGIRDRDELARTLRP